MINGTEECCISGICYCSIRLFSFLKCQGEGRISMLPPTYMALPEFANHLRSQSQTSRSDLDLLHDKLG